MVSSFAWRGDTTSQIQSGRSFTGVPVGTDDARLCIAVLAALVSLLDDLSGDELVKPLRLGDREELLEACAGTSRLAHDEVRMVSRAYVVTGPVATPGSVHGQDPLAVGGSPLQLTSAVHVPSLILQPPYFQ